MGRIGDFQLITEWKKAQTLPGTSIQKCQWRKQDYTDMNDQKQTKTPLR